MQKIILVMILILVFGQVFASSPLLLKVEKRAAEIGEIARFEAKEYRQIRVMVICEDVLGYLDIGAIDGKEFLKMFEIRGRCNENILISTPPDTLVFKNYARASYRIYIWGDKPN